MIKELISKALEHIDEAGFYEEQKQALIAFSECLLSDAELTKKANAYYTHIFSNTTDNTKPSKMTDGIFEEDGMTFALVYLARLSELGNVLEKRGIPKSYAKGAFWHYRDLFDRSFKRYGVRGFFGMYRDGMVKYILPYAFRIGRLIFEIGKFFGPYEVYTDKKDGTVLPIAREGYFYREDGRQLPKGLDTNGVFMSSFSEKDGQIFAHTFSNNGLFEFEKRVFEIDRLQKALSVEDDILWVHIPADGRMTPEDVDASFLEAREFFARYFPSVKFRAFVCSSWLLDTGLRRFLKEGSNILAFQDKFRIVLSHTNEMALFWNVFGIENTVSLSELTPQNSLQTQILDHVNAGGHLYSGNGFILLL